MRRLVLLVLVVVPCRLRILFYRHVFGWKIGSRVRIGFSYISADRVDIGDNVRIGHFNNIRGVRELVIGSDTYLLNFNQLFGASYDFFPCSVTIGKNVGIMSRHYLDCAGTIVIGDQAKLAGRDSHLWSHTVTLIDGGQKLVPTTVKIGQKVYVGARSTLVGCSIPAEAMVGAGAVVTKNFENEPGRVLIAGNPAKVVKRYDVPAESPQSPS